MGDVMSAAKRFLSLFLSATLVVGMTPDCAYAKVTAQMLRAAASQLPSPAQGDAGDGAPQATPDGTGAAQGQESAQGDAPQAAPDGAEAAQGDAGAGAGGQAAGSQSADQGDGLSWREAEGGVEVTGYAGDATDLAIPSELGGRPVVRVGGGAFRGCTALRSVSLPPTVESVGDGAFSGCSSLASLTLPEGLRRLGSNAFTGCPLESVTVPASLESTGAHRWASGPFEGSSLRSATLAEGSARVVPGLFSGCSKLSSVSVPGTVTSVGEYAFRGCSGLPASLEVPPSVRELRDCAYEGCTSLESVTLPDRFERVGANAFRGCSSLASVMLPASVAYVGDGAFEGCSDALTLRFPMNYVLLKYVFENHLRYEIPAGNLTMGKGVIDVSRSGYSCEGTDGEGHLRLRLRYEVAEGMREGLSDMTLRLRLSEHAKVVEGSVRLNGEALGGLVERRGMLTVPVSAPGGSLEFSVREATHGSLLSYASLNYTRGGERHDDLIGYVDEELPKTTMELPALVGAGCLVGGVAAPGSTVTILADGEPAGSGEVDAKGRYLVPVSVAGGEGRAYSFQALAGGDASVARDAEYDPGFPEVSAITLEYKSRGEVRKLELMDPAAGDTHTHRDTASPPIYRVAFTRPDDVVSVRVTGMSGGRELALEATRDADGTWVTDGFFDDADKGFTPDWVRVTHVAKSATLPWWKSPIFPEWNQEVADKIFGDYIGGKFGEIFGQSLEERVERERRELKGYLLVDGRQPSKEETARGLARWAVNEYGATARSKALGMLPITDNISAEDMRSKLDKALTYGARGTLILELLEKKQQVGLSSDEEAVLAYNMVKVLIGMYSFMSVQNSLGVDVLVNAQLFSLATIMEMCEALDGGSGGGYGAYGSFWGVAEKFKIAFTRFSETADGAQDRVEDELMTLEEKFRKWWEKFGKQKDTTPGHVDQSHDPSGYVYEAVPSNRLQGAEVSLYFEDDVSQAPLLWDAAAYGQEACQVTGADGAFGWDVPCGRWQVRCTMAGYEPYVGEWLEVPPERMNVGVAMVSLEAPRVTCARVSEDSVLLSFSRFMDPGSLGGLKLFDAGGEEVPFELSCLAEEGEGGRSYARDCALRLAEGVSMPAVLRVSGSEESYAGVHMVVCDVPVLREED